MQTLPITIAIVDDNAGIRQALGRLLKSAGYDSCGFASGEEFLAFQHFASLRCAIIDIHMPGIGGLLTIERLRQGHPALPLIAVTGGHTEHIESSCWRLGVSAYFTKPIDADRLLLTIERQLLPLPGRTAPPDAL